MKDVTANIGMGLLAFGVAVFFALVLKSYNLQGQEQREVAEIDQLTRAAYNEMDPRVMEAEGERWAAYLETVESKKTGPRPKPGTSLNSRSCYNLVGDAVDRYY